MTSGPSPKDLVARLGPVGVWCSQLQWQPATRAQEAVGEIEELGYAALWVGEATGKEVMTHAAILLASGGRIVVATGIASIWARDPMAMANAGRTLAEAYPGRFVMGLGVSHPFLNEPRDRPYQRPLSAMRDYLEAMDSAPYVGPEADMPPRLLAALGPKMIELARDRTFGAHPYLVPVEHTALARGILGRGPVLAPEQAVVLEQDPRIARDLARSHLSTYLGLSNYADNLRRLGYEEEDLDRGGSDRLVDALVAWGDVDAILRRVTAHRAAGADHVAIRILVEDPARLPLQELRAVASALAEAVPG
ncbi:TIGR03620 family F420-dependent LLM class oxidoreductase [soil metagenome]